MNTETIERIEIVPSEAAHEIKLKLAEIFNALDNSAKEILNIAMRYVNRELTQFEKDHVATAVKNYMQIYVNYTLFEPILSEEYREDTDKVHKAIIKFLEETNAFKAHFLDIVTGQA